MLVLLFLLFGPSFGLDMYCPSSSDLQWDYGEGEGCMIHNQGWQITGGARVSTKAAFNLLGGWVEFDMDISKSFVGANNNVYGTFPTHSPGNYNTNMYCDGQDIAPYWCPEMDFIENNGPVAWGSTWHTVPGLDVPNVTSPPNAVSNGCDSHGCAADRLFDPPPWYQANCKNSSNTGISSALPFKLRINFDQYTGDMVFNMTQGNKSVTLQGAEYTNDYGIPPQAYDRSVVKAAMVAQGLVVSSSQWTGWVPADDVCPSYNPTYEGSMFKVMNLKLYGMVTRGSATKCAHQASDARMTEQVAV